MSTWSVTQGDCLELLKSLPSGSVDAVVTDPPYGIGYVASRYRGAKFSGVIHGDDSPFDPSALLSIGVPTIMWGGNNFANSLPRGGWLCWDKRCCEEADRIHGSPFELAWVSDCAKFKMKRLQHCGAVSADRTARVHPTQKPIELMRWCLDLLGIPEGATVLDPYCGSGTTGVACVQTGRNFIGYEIDPKYCEIARRRIEAAVPLFAEVAQ